MCITLPGKILKINKDQAEIEVDGSSRLVKSFDQDFKEGDWVLTTDEYLVKKISEQEAKEISDLFGYYPPNKNNNKYLFKILDKALTEELNIEEIEFLLGLNDESDLMNLYTQANVVRLSASLNHICIHGIIEFSNYCKNDCHYCGLRVSNKKIKRCRLNSEELVRVATEAVNLRGYKILVLQSGEDNFYTIDDFKKIIIEIKKQARVFLYLSVGELSLNDYEELKKAGLNGVLMRFESSDKEIYQKLRPNKDIEDRLKLIKNLKSLGLIMATGFMIGLPEQDNKKLAKDLLLLKELNPFMPSIGPLVPSMDTPLADYVKPDKNKILKVISIIRLLMPKARLPITTAMETLYGENFRQEAFLAGANSLMLNLTPPNLRHNYYIYENKFFDEEKKFEKWALFKGDLSYQMLEEELKIQI